MGSATISIRVSMRITLSLNIGMANKNAGFWLTRNLIPSGKSNCVLSTTSLTCRATFPDPEYGLDQMQKWSARCIKVRHISREFAWLVVYRRQSGKGYCLAQQSGDVAVGRMGRHARPNNSMMDKKRLSFFDELAELARDPDESFDKIRKAYQNKKKKLYVPERVFNGLKRHSERI